MSPPPLILYDGICGLCQRSVRFILRWERMPEFHFLPLQSDKGRELLRKHGVPADTDAIVLIESNEARTGADAALLICKRLRAPVRWLTAFRVLPRSWRDGLYRAVAKRRYRWFGKTDTCELPSPEHAERFL